MIRHFDIWGPEYLRQRVRRLAAPAKPTKRIWVMLADHFEPMWNRADLIKAQARVRTWRSAWPMVAERCKSDTAGNPPRYTFFYPEEEYHPSLLEPLAEMVRQGIADIEVHLHHDGEGRQNFIDRISSFCHRLYSDHGTLRKHNGKLTFGFVHGNWALANSRPDGRWCGLNDEIQLLQRLGCYADFTMPSGNSPTQARLINTIYWCKSDSQRPKSYDDGIPLGIGHQVEGDLLMIPGPLGIRWRDRIKPRLETGELSSYDVATPYRAKRWIDLSPRIGADRFLKLYTHGAQERNSSALLGGGLERAFDLIVSEAAQRECDVYFVSAWQMYRTIDALRQRLDPVAIARTSQPLPGDSVLAPEAPTYHAS